MFDEREAAINLLKALQKAIQRAESLGESESEDVRVFAVDAVGKLAEMEIMLLQALSGEEETGDSNPLARRSRLER